MTLLKFNGGTAGVPVYICPAFIIKVLSDPSDPALTLICTEDGREHRVQQSLDETIAILTAK